MNSIWAITSTITTGGPETLSFTAIYPQEFYNTGPMPVFKTKEAAEKYLKEIRPFGGSEKVEEIQLLDREQNPTNPVQPL